MKLILITAPQTLSYEIEVLETAAALGVYRIHIRKPNANPSVIQTLLEQLSHAVRNISSIHYYPEYVNKFGLSGFHSKHLTRKKITNEENIFLKNNEKIIKSASFHSFAEINQKKCVDYGFCSPVFPSISKIGYKPSFEWNVNSIHTPSMLFALGGIHENNIKACKKKGFDGVAVLGRIWGEKTAQNAIDTLIKIKNRCDQLQ